MFKEGDKVIFINGYDSHWNDRHDTNSRLPEGLINQKGIVINKDYKKLVVMVIGGKYEDFNFNFDINSKALKLDKIIKKII